jgi:hypothetical protein
MSKRFAVILLSAWACAAAASCEAENDNDVG